MRLAHTICLRWIVSSAAFRARTFQRQGKGRGCGVGVLACGGKCTVSSTNSHRLGSWLKMYLRCELEARTMCSVRWKRKATPRGRSWWVPVMLAPCIEGTASSSWPTPAARDRKEAGHEPAAQARKSPNLPAAVQLWPTPTAKDEIGSGAAAYSTASGRHAGTTLTDAAVRGIWAGRHDPASPSMPGNRIGSRRLNPDWVECLMGFPVGWTDVLVSDSLVMPSFRKSRKSSQQV